MPSQPTLAHHPLFAGLAAADIQKIEAHCLWRRIEAQCWLLDFGDAGTDVFFVSQGKLRVVLLSANREVYLRDLDAGSFFGELAAIDGQPRSAGIIAVTDAVVGRLPAAEFRRAIHAHPSVCDTVLHRLAAEVRKLANQVNELSTMSINQRLPRELIRLARPSQQSESVWVITPPPTHAELAARIGTHREAVARELKALERRGFVERRRGAFALLDLPGLQKQCAVET